MFVYLKSEKFMRVIVNVAAFVCFFNIHTVQAQKVEVSSAQKKLMHVFELEPQELGEALVAFAIQSETSVLVEFSVVEGFTSGEVVGKFTNTSALALLLLDTPFTYEYEDALQGFRIVLRDKPDRHKSIDPEESEDLQEHSLIEVVTVKGIRASLTNSLDRKRFSINVIDALTSEDIGKFPDSNLAESLQRISGVTASYSNGEGGKISLRGLDPNFNLVTFNGRQMPIANFKEGVIAGSRSLDLSELASENISAVEVHKTSKASQPTGGIGALVNIKTSRPLELNERTTSLGVSAVSDSSNVSGSDVTPEFFGLYSQRFFDDTFGVLVSGSFQERHNRQEKAEMTWWKNQVYRFADDPSAWAVIDGDDYYPMEMETSISDIERKRENAQLVFQYAPIEQLVSTFDYTYSELNIAKDGVLLSSGFDRVFDGGLPVLGPGGTAISSREAGGRYEFSSVREHHINQTDSLGLNIAWQVADTFDLEIDAHTSEATLGPGGIGNRSVVTYEVGNIHALNFDSRFDVPQVSYEFGGQDNSEVRSDIVIDDFIRRSSGEVSWDEVHSKVSELKLSGNWHFSPESWVKKISFGVLDTDVEHESSKGTNTFFDPFGWSNDPISNYDETLFSPVRVSNILSAYSGGLDDNLLYFAFDPDEVVALNTDRLSGVSADQFPSRNPYESIRWSDFRGPNGNPEEANMIDEHSIAVYVQADVGVSVFDVPIDIVAGLRYEETKVSTESVYFQPVAISWLGEFFRTEFSDEQRSLFESARYDSLLPSVNVRVSFTDEWVARLSYSETLTRSEMDLMRATTEIIGSPETNSKIAFEGQAGLLPYSSENIDITLDWYYSENSYASLGWFEKSVSDFPVDVGTNKPLFGLTDASLGERADTAREALVAEGIVPDSTNIYEYLAADLGIQFPEGLTGNDTDPLILWNVSSAVNGDQVSLDGIEFSLQHLFGDSGYGVLFNYTQLQSDADNVISNVSRFSSLLPFNRDYLNFSAFYDKYGFQFRAAYHWNDEYKVVINNTALWDRGVTDSIVTEAYGQLDVLLSYSFRNTDTTVFIEGINVSSESPRRYYQHESRLAEAEQFSSRYKAGVRFAF